MNRRQLIGRAAGMGMTFALGPRFWGRALAAPAQAGESPYGPLLGPDANGLLLPAGFSSRIVANGGLPVPGVASLYRWHVFPDGGACLPTDDGGWVYVSNSEFPPPVDVPLPAELRQAVLALLGVVDLDGRVSAVRFDATGEVIDAYPILEGTQSNCAGGLTPWGTWLSCEEIDDGRVFECDPLGPASAAVVRPALGVFKHEMVAVDPVDRRLYLTEDQTDGLLYRFTPTTWEDLSAGTLEAAQVDDTTGAVTWVEVTDPLTPDIRGQPALAAAKRFNGGEGIVHDQGRVYFTTKGDNRVWVLDVAAQTITVLYAAATHPTPVLTGVDNIVVSAAHDLYVAEDGGNLEVCIITPDLVVAPVVRMTSTLTTQHGFELIAGVPTVSEVSGLAFSPDGDRLYFNSMRANVAGILYEVTGPWRGGSLAAVPTSPAPVPVVVPQAPASTPSPELPATGDNSLVGAGGLAVVAAAAAWHLRRRLDRD